MRRKSVLALLAILLTAGFVAARDASAATGPMPPFSAAWAATARDFYKIAWTDDNYPARREPDGTLYEHPIYPVYVIADYFRQYAVTPTTELRDAIDIVAHAALRRMSAHHGGLVIWYAEGDTARATRRYYSGLTTAYYAEQLQQAADLTGDADLADAAHRSMTALTVPSGSNGVLFTDRNGASVAEVPQRPNSYVLNGWLSALVSMWRYWLRSGDTRARDLVLGSAATVAKVLPRFDDATRHLSRYGLTGYVGVRVVGTTYSELSVTIPGEGTFRPTTGKPYRWEIHRAGPSQANIVLSYASWPTANTLTMRPAKPAKVQALIGRYDPLTAAPNQLRWVDIGMVTPSRPTIKVPWRIFDTVVYPTNFAKKLEGHQVNVYHTIHVNQLAELYRLTGVAGLLQWSEKWRADMCLWGKSPLFRGLYAARTDGGQPRIVPVGQLCVPRRERRTPAPASDPFFYGG
jgi:hypothetical protein